MHYKLSLCMFYLLTVESVISSILSKQKEFQFITTNVNSNNVIVTNNKVAAMSNKPTNRNIRHSVPSTTRTTTTISQTTSSSTSQSQVQVDLVNYTAKVGDTVILNCVINASYGINPGVIWMQGNLGNVLTLNTNRITVDSRFEIVQQPIQKQSSEQTEVEQQQPQQQLTHREKVKTHLLKGSSSNETDKPDEAVNGKQIFSGNEFSFYHLKINNVQLYDENEYACETSITKRNEDQPNLHSLIYLHVTQSPSFIESQTSESNVAALEYTDQTLKCSAVGKPAPKIKWYQIDELNGIIRDLSHESTTLTLRNISKFDTSKYECVANNGILPSVSKKFTITVYYSPIVKALQEKATQYTGQTVTLACGVISNPESAINWYKLDRSESSYALSPSSSVSKSLTSSDPTNYDDDNYVVIEPSATKYQTHKNKQTNQTVSYLKIKNLDANDYGRYKCEASNVVGKYSATIELIEIKEIHNVKSGKTKTPKTKHQKVASDSNNDEEIDLDDGQYLINLDSERNSIVAGELSESSSEKEYKLVTKTNDENKNFQSSNKKKTMKYNFRNEHGSNSSTSSNKSLQNKHPLSKTNRIIDTDEDETQDENNLNRKNDYLSSYVNKLKSSWMLTVLSSLCVLRLLTK